MTSPEARHLDAARRLLCNCGRTKSCDVRAHRCTCAFSLYGHAHASALAEAEGLGREVQREEDARACEAFNARRRREAAEMKAAGEDDSDLAESVAYGGTLCARAIRSLAPSGLAGFLEAAERMAEWESLGTLTYEEGRLRREALVSAYRAWQGAAKAAEGKG